MSDTRANEIIFMPLGGGQTIGASCYFLKLGNANILLDCGIGFKDGVPFAPNFHALLSSPYLQSPAQISQIFISHAHLDHAGWLSDFLMQSKSDAAVYMTDMTFLLIEHQISMFHQKDYSVKRELLNSIVTRVSYMQQIPFGKCRATFYQAGHIPGAMMVLIEYRNRRILYTGDYSISSTPGTNGCRLPDGEIDLLILCGLHARHSSYRRSHDKLPYIIQKIKRALQHRRSVFYRVRQLSKGWELIKLLNDHLNVPIYLDDSILKLIKRFELKIIRVLEQNNYPLSAGRKLFPNVVLSMQPNFPFDPRYERLDEDFSLHDDFDDTVRFVKKINPKTAIVVHSPPPLGPFDETIEQQLMNDADCRTQFVFANEGEAYVF